MNNKTRWIIVGVIVLFAILYWTVIRKYIGDSSTTATGTGERPPCNVGAECDTGSGCGTLEMGPRGCRCHGGGRYKADGTCNPSI